MLQKCYKSLTIVRHGGEKPKTCPRRQVSKAASLAERETMIYRLYLYNESGEKLAAATLDAFFRFTDGAATLPTANGGALRIAKTENSVYADAAAIAASTDGAARFRVYPIGGVALALHCATAAARTAANRGGKAAATEHKNADAQTPTDAAAANKAAAKMHKQTNAARNIATQETIFRELKIITAATAAAMASDGGTDIDAFVLEKAAAMAQDTQDFLSVCVLAAFENASAEADAAAAAIYKAANAYIRGNVSRRERETSTEYILDGGGDLVSFGTAAAAILRGGEKWTPTDGGKMDAATAARLGKALSGAFALVSPTERDIIRAVVNGFSVRQAAAKMKRNPRTITRNLDNIRKTFAEYIAENAAEFLPIISAARTAAERNAERTAAAQAERNARRRENEKNGTASGKTAAERMREYRARRKAAAMAQA